jgi:membrane-associated phospholipid phosphatase
MLPSGPFRTVVGVSEQRAWFLDVNRFSRSTPVLHDPVRLYAVYGVVLFALLLALGWWLARRNGSPRTMAASLWAPVGAVVAIGLNQPLGRAVHEARPYTVFPHELVLVARTHDFSFPSDHAVMAGAVAAGVLLVDRRLGVLTWLLALLLAFARVFVGAHFPLDVEAGLLFGAAVSLVGYLLVRRPLTLLVQRLSRTQLRPLLTSAPPGVAR